MAIRTTSTTTTVTATKSEPTPTRLYDYVEPATVEPSRAYNYTFEPLAPVQPSPTVAPDTYAERVYDPAPSYTKPDPTPTRLYDYVEPATVEPSRAYNYTFEPLAPVQPYPTVIPDTYAEPTYAPAPAPAPTVRPLRLRPKACPVDAGRTIRTGTTGATGATGAAGAAGAAGLPGATGVAALPGAAGVYFTGGVTSTLAREITVSRGTGGLLEPTDSYSRGVIQGLQRALFAFAVSRGRGIALVADGILNRDTVAIALSVIAEIGLPPNVSPMPRSDEDIARNCRAYANHIARAAGVAIDFRPVTSTNLNATAQTAVAPSTSPQSTPAKLFSGRNITIGAVLFGGFALLRR